MRYRHKEGGRNGQIGTSGTLFNPYTFSEEKKGVNSHNFFISVRVILL